jgi:predicted DNA-binding transcriptional regulator AlpA
MPSSTESLSRKTHSPATSPLPEKPAKALATTRPWTLLGFGRSTWYRLVAQGRAPVGIRVTRKKRIWSIAELQRWLDRSGPDDLPALSQTPAGPSRVLNRV